MKKKLTSLKIFVIIIIALTLNSCADYFGYNANNNSDGKVGLPGGVNILNSDLQTAKSRSAEGLIAPAIRTTMAHGGSKPLYCRYTTTPGIVTKQSKNTVVTKPATRGMSITTNSFYDSYSLYTYLYSNADSWSAVATTTTPTYLDEQVKRAMSWMTAEFWPGTGNRCAFFAYAPYHAVGLSKFTTTGWPTFHYSVPNDVVAQSDLLVTRNEVSLGLGHYGSIDVPGNFNMPDSLTFDHACTAVRFAIGSQMAPGIIKKIELRNVYGAADYKYSTETWNNLDTLKTFTLTQDFEIRSGESNKILNNDDNIFMMLPQKVPASATMAITIDDGTPHTITASIGNDEWKKGYTVTYYLSTAKVSDTYVLAIVPSSTNIPLKTSGTNNVTINSYKQSYYGSQIAVPWTASYSYDDPNEGTSATYNKTTDVVPGFVDNGKGSTTTTGESVAFTVAAQVARSRSWRSSHTQTLRNAADASGNLAAGKRTANCYVVQAPGTYTFPLVYGNSLNADGSSNDDSYKTPTFVDHNGVQIDSPYIYMTNGGANVPYDACIVWQDAPHLVTPSSVQLTSDKHSIQFTVERKNICAGNCVIAVRDKNQNIMWSWHIWVTDHNMSNTIAVKNKDGYTSNFMEVPLGWCDAEVRVYDKRTFHLNVKQSETGGQTASADIIQLSNDSTYEYGVNAPYYQWGRKDPFLPSNGMGNVDKPYYDNQYPVFARQNAAVSTNVAILHPNIFYFIIDSNWSSTNNLEYWNKGNTATTVNNNTVYKTIYSPSLTGYKEPTTAAFTGFTSSGDNSTSSGFNVSGGFNKGWNFYCLPDFTGSTVFFSASGFRSSQHWDANNSTGGVIVDFGVYGSFLSAGPSTSGYARFLFFDSGRIWPQNEYSRSDGHLIRPVSE